MPNKPRKAIADLIGELQSWLPNYDHGPDDYPTLLWRLLASMPGGEQAADMGYEPFKLGWHEVEQLGNMLVTVQDKRDVEDLVAGLVGEEEEESGEVDEARRAPRGRRQRGPKMHAAHRSGMESSRSKHDVEIALLSGVAPMGGRIDVSDVATVSRDRRAITLRHAWPENVDARVWHNLMSLVRAEARRVADQTGRPVEVYAKQGWVIDSVEPERRR